jgi:tetraacyldisaccharide 4'-kinase
MQVFLRIILFPVWFLYLIIIRVRNLLYDKDLLRTYRVSCKVISVGNVSFGGTGKTPLVIHFARYLKSRGMKVTVLTRGYKGTKSQKEPFVVSDGFTLYGDVQQCGDEALLIAQSAEVPVIIGKDRVLSAKEALGRFHPDYLILDDGFQHRKLYRDIDIVLLSSHDVLHVFPLGNLREPLSSLKRASVIGITKGSYSKLKDTVIKAAANKNIVEINYDITALKIASNLLPACSISGKKIIVMSAIAHSNYFINQIQELGAHIVHSISYPDHYYYSKDDRVNAEKLVHKFSADAIAVTEKDLIKLESSGKLNEIYWTAILTVSASNLESILLD